LQSLITTTTSNVSSEKEMLDTTLRSDCYIRFQNPHMRLCNFVPYGNNFGDELGPAVTLRILQEYFVCANVSAVPVVNLAAVGFPVQRRSNESCLFAVGSIFHFVRSGDHVWGTGINPFRRRKEMHATDIVVHSVRGPLSLEWLLEKRTSFITASLVGFGDVSDDIVSPLLLEIVEKSKQAHLTVDCLFLSCLRTAWILDPVSLSRILVQSSTETSDNEQE
jgi:hypothetical protein